MFYEMQMDDAVDWIHGWEGNLETLLSNHLRANPNPWICLFKRDEKRRKEESEELLNFCKFLLHLPSVPFGQTKCTCKNSKWKINEFEALSSLPMGRRKWDIAQKSKNHRQLRPRSLQDDFITTNHSKGSWGSRSSMLNSFQKVLKFNQRWL